MAAGDKKWDAAAERDLCVAIIMGNQEGRTNYNWPKVHAFLTKLGYKFTKDAISYVSLFPQTPIFVPPPPPSFPYILQSSSSSIPRPPFPNLVGQNKDLETKAHG